MPTPTNLESASAWAGGLAIVSTVGTLLLRFLMKTFRSDRLEAVSSSAEVGSYARLQGEIERLSKKYDELEIRFNAIRDMELEDVADIATLSVLINQMPCGRCGTPDELFQQAHEVLVRMNTRKRMAQTLIRATDHTDDK